MDLEMENDVMESDEQTDNSEIEENDEPSNDDNSQGFSYCYCGSYWFMVCENGQRI